MHEFKRELTRKSFCVAGISKKWITMRNVWWTWNESEQRGITTCGEVATIMKVAA